MAHVSLSLFPREILFSLFFLDSFLRSLLNLRSLHLLRQFFCLSIFSVDSLSFLISIFLSVDSMMIFLMILRK
ncbi:unnamed protein product [Brassica rapa subsp. narinosa]